MDFTTWLLANDFVANEAEESMLTAAAREKLHEQFEAEYGGEAGRIRGLRAVADRYMRDGTPAADVQAALTAAESGTTTSREFDLQLRRATRPAGPPNIIGGGAPTTMAAIEAGLLCRAGHEAVAIKAFGAQTVESARRSRINSLVDLCGAVLHAEHRDVPHGHDATIRAAFSTTALPNILGNVVGRTLVASYIDATSDWRSFATIKSAADFKPQTAIRPTSLEVLEQLAGDGEIAHSDITEEATYPWRVDTFARMVAVTRQTIINDDLGFVSDLAPALGRAAARSLNDLLWATIMANAGDFFDSGNGNLAEGGSALAVGSLGAAVSAMRSQRDSRGYDIQLSPVALAVPPGLELTARNLLNSAELITGDDSTLPSGNPVAGIVPNLVVESRLSNTDRFTGASTTAYYLFASPASNAVIVGFLRGQQSPTVEIADADFNRLGIQLRVFHDYGVALGDPRAAHKSTGAG